MAKKYEFTDETKKIGNHVLHRIIAVRTFDCPSHNPEPQTIKKGDLGGFIESEGNLSHNGKCWVADNACVYDAAMVENDAHVSRNAKVRDRAIVVAESWVTHDATVRDSAEISGSAFIGGSAVVKDAARILGNAGVLDNAVVGGSVTIWLYENIRGEAVVNTDKDYLMIGPMDSDHTILTAFRTKKGIMASYRNVTVALRHLESRIRGDHTYLENWESYIAAIPYIKYHFGL